MQGKRQLESRSELEQQIIRIQSNGPAVEGEDLSSKWEGGGRERHETTGCAASNILPSRSRKNPTPFMVRNTRPSQKQGLQMSLPPDSQEYSMRALLSVAKVQDSQQISTVLTSLHGFDYCHFRSPTENSIGAPVSQLLLSSSNHILHLPTCRITVPATNSNFLVLELHLHQ